MEVQEVPKAEHLEAPPSSVLGQSCMLFLANHVALHRHRQCHMMILIRRCARVIRLIGIVTIASTIVQFDEPGVIRKEKSEGKTLRK